MVFLWIIFALAVLLLISILVSLPITRRSTNWKQDSPARFGLTYSDIEFPSLDGVPLRGWWIPVVGSTKTVIFLHGYQGSMDPDLQYAPWLHEAGYNLLMFDFRAHGRSGGQITSIGGLEKRDALAAISFAKDKGSSVIGLLGFSMGGRVAVLAGAVSPLVNAVVCDCGPARISTALAMNLKHRGIPPFLSKALACYLLVGVSLRAGINLFRSEPLDAAKGLQNKPSFFLQGAKDPNILIEETQQMVKNAGDHASLWLVEDAGHRDISDLHPEEYRSRILEFFAQAL